MKKYALLSLLILSPLSLFCGDIAPPSWILGTWSMEFKGEMMELTFLENDIIMNGESLSDMIENGYITSYKQASTAAAFSIRVEYADGFWWMERFPKPAMGSAYTDKSYAGGIDTLHYTRIK